MITQSRSDHILELAKELLDDIELGRTDAERLILKSSRLARWVGSDEVRYWLKLELGGYNSTNHVSLKYMGITGRWLDQNKGTGYWGLLLSIRLLSALRKQSWQRSVFRTQVVITQTSSFSMSRKR